MTCKSRLTSIFIVPDNRTRNAVVTVSESLSDIDDDAKLCVYQDGVLEPSVATTLYCSSPMIGRYVQLKLITHDYMNIQEIEVHGYYA